MLGKTNTPTFGWIGLTDNLLFGVTRNPWNLEPHAGRLVAAGAGGRRGGRARRPLAIGTDGGGSIRKPAPRSRGSSDTSPRSGRIPIHPAGAAWSLSHVGPMTRTVKDAALMMNVCAGPDERDQYSLPARPRRLREGAQAAASRACASPGAKTLGYRARGRPRGERGDARRRRARFRELGCRVERSSRAGRRPTIAGAPSSSAASARGWRRYLDRRDADRPRPAADRRGGPALPRRPDTCRRGSSDSRGGSTRAASSSATTCCSRRRSRARRFPSASSITRPRSPASPSGARRRAPFTFPFNMTGQPAASVPCGFTKAGLPIGLQIVGPPLRRRHRAARSAAFEAAQPWASRRPDIGER